MVERAKDSGWGMRWVTIIDFFDFKIDLFDIKMVGVGVGGRQSVFVSL